MQKPLEKNEFLLQLESLLKKYGFTTMYCHGGFDGTKKGGLDYFILTEPNHQVNKEFNMLVDPVWGLEEYDWRDMSGMCFCSPGKTSIEWLGEPAYRNGEFYAVEG